MLGMSRVASLIMSSEGAPRRMFGQDPEAE